MGKKRAASKGGYRNVSTEDAIVQTVAASNGDADRREVVRKLGHRSDFASALLRLKRRGEIEVVATEMRGPRTLWRVRLIGEVAKQKGAGLVRVGGKR